MTGRRPDTAQQSFFRDHGWLSVRDGLAADELVELQQRTRPLIERRAELCHDLSRVEQGGENVLISAMELAWPDWRSSRFHQGCADAATRLMGRPVQFWYNLLLIKPPRDGARTWWHQDEGCIGGSPEDLIITCWIPLQDVDEENGCMRFLDRGHRLGILPGLHETGGRSGLAACGVDESGVVSVPLRAGGMTWHHGKTPHASPPNLSPRFRLALIQRFTVVGVPIPTGHLEDGSPAAGQG